MKATLEFSLPEESEEFNMASNASILVSAIREFDEMLRSMVKYGHEFKKTDSADKILSDIRNKLHETLQERGINLYDL